MLADDVDLGLDDALAALDELGDLVFACERFVACEVLATGTEDGEDGLAEGLGRDGAGVDGDAADVLHLFNDADTAAEFGGLDGGFLAAGSGTDDNEVKVAHSRSFEAQTGGEPVTIRRRVAGLGSLSVGEKGGFGGLGKIRSAGAAESARLRDEMRRAHGATCRT